MLFRCLLFISCVFFSCEKPVNSTAQEIEPPIVWSAPEVSVEFNRAGIEQALRGKIDAGEPLVVHVFVPLCDNENQGIVPVSKALGNGMDPRNNLYWGALYGIKTHFKKQKDWTILSSENDLTETILERVVFKRNFQETTVYLVADAYRGDRMEACVSNYMAAASGNSIGVHYLSDTTLINTAGGADLVVFNGHNGLMDPIQTPNFKFIGRQKDAMVIACASASYFNPRLKDAGAYPLLMTTNLMAPEAYVLEAAVNSWAELNSGEAVRTNAATAYNKYQKCGMRGALNLFQTGW